MNIVQFSLSFCIRLYQLFISPILVFILGPSARCRFNPSCSQYAREAIEKHGVIRGAWLALRRLGRCHPGGKCGDDPCPPSSSSVKHTLRTSGICHGS